MKSVTSIPKYILNDLNSNQLNMLFDLTELQLKWFDMYYPLLNPPFYKLLESNHKKILNFLKVDLMGEYSQFEIDAKFNRMFNAYYSLFEISRQQKIYTNKQINTNG